MHALSAFPHSSSLSCPAQIKQNWLSFVFSSLFFLPSFLNLGLLHPSSPRLCFSLVFLHPSFLYLALLRFLFSVIWFSFTPFILSSSLILPSPLHFFLSSSSLPALYLSFFLLPSFLSLDLSASSLPLYQHKPTVTRRAARETTS